MELTLPNDNGPKEYSSIAKGAEEPFASFSWQTWEPLWSTNSSSLQWCYIPLK